VSRPSALASHPIVWKKHLRTSLVMEQMGQVCYEQNATDQTKRLNAAARCMAIYQQGLLALHKMRQNGQQCIMVQYVNVSNRR
jgi:hypothetical protein